MALMYYGIKNLNKKMKEHKEEKKQQKAVIGQEDPVDAQHRQEHQAPRTSSEVYQAPAGHAEAQQTAGYGNNGGQSWDGKK